jgi:cytochrome c
MVRLLMHPSCAATFERVLLAASVAIGACVAPGFAHAADAAAGGKVFATECAECHSVREGKDKKGPSLFGIWGAKAAQREGFVYSDAMRGAGITWTAENLADYVAAPKKKVPGGKMKYDGLQDAKQRDDLLAWLAEATKR